jgi:hypothetical protein
MTPPRAKGQQGADGRNGNADPGTECGALAHDVVMRPIEMVACPHCGREFPFTAALRAQLAGAMDDAVHARVAQAVADAAQAAREQARLEVEAARQEALDTRAMLDEARQRELTLLRREQQLQDREGAAELELARRLATERDQLRQAEAARLGDEFERNTLGLREELDAMRQRLRVAEEAEQSLRRQRVDIEAREHALELEVQRRIDDQRPSLVEHALRAAGQQHAVELEQKAIEVRRLTDQIEALRHTASVAQELQGEAQEVVLRDLLASVCPHDLVSDVPRGKRGGDLLHEVRNAIGQRAGLVLWECKSAKTWSEGWIEKLKFDQRACEADVAVLVSTVLPRGIEHVGLHNGVFVASLPAATGVAHLVRHLVLRLATARADSTTRDFQLRELHEVLCSNAFRLRCQSIFDSVAAMSRDLESERASAHRWFARRERQIAQFSHAAAEVVGQIEGATGTRHLDGPTSTTMADEAQEAQTQSPSASPDAGRNGT